MRPPMLHTAYKVTTTRNAYGDFVDGAEVAHKCHFRYSTQHTPGSGNETMNSDALAWFMPGSGIEEQDVLVIDDLYWRVERVVKARKLRNSAVQFIKVELLRYGVIS